MTSRDGKPFPRRNDLKLVAKGVSGTLQDNTVIFERGGQEGFSKATYCTVQYEPEELENSKIRERKQL